MYQEAVTVTIARNEYTDLTPIGAAVGDEIESS